VDRLLPYLPPGRRGRTGSADGSGAAEKGDIMTEAQVAVIRKIRKLLSKTEGNGATQAEAETALLAAERLAAAHSLHMASAYADESIEFEAEVGITKRKRSAFTTFALMVAESAFLVRILQTRNTAGNRTYQVEYTFVGDKLNVETAIRAAKFIEGEFRDAWNRFRLSHRLSGGHRQCNSFVRGLAVGLIGRIQDDRKSLDRRAESGTLVVMRETLDRAFEEKFPNVGSVEAPQAEHHSLYHAGRKAGAEINIDARIRS
jgi:Protein of unknown function (DUF2786)